MIILDLIFEHGSRLFILFLFPLIGLSFENLFSKKTNFFVLITSIVLFLPLAFGYHYIIPYFYPILALITFSSAYALLLKRSKKIKRKATLSIILSIVLLAVLFYIALIHAFSGIPQVKQRWKVDGYKIEYVEEGGFSGVYHGYTLNQYAKFPLFFKEIDTLKGYPEDCEIHFSGVDLIFDRCEGNLDLEKLVEKRGLK